MTTLTTSTHQLTHDSAPNRIQRWHVSTDFETIADAVLSRLSQCASEAIAERGVFSIVLAGGNTPQALYREFDGIATDWRCWRVYFGDERCLPVGDNDRNDAMAYRSWLDHVPIPRQQIFSIPAESGAAAGAAAYDNLLASVPAFDVVLLGLGEDGHTASLFPGIASAHLQKNAAAIAVYDAPKLPHARISMSAERLSDAKEVWFLASGEGKRTALTQLRRGAAIPASAIKPKGGIDIFTDIELD